MYQAFLLLCAIFFLLMAMLATYTTIGMFCGDRSMPMVEVKSGPHAGRTGKIVSVPWGGNFYNLRPTVNVAATELEIRARYGDRWGGRIEELIEDMRKGYGPREWIEVWRSNLEVIEK